MVTFKFSFSPCQYILALLRIDQVNRMIDWTSSALRDRISVSQIALQYLCIKYTRILLNCTAVFMLLIYMCND